MTSDLPTLLPVPDLLLHVYAEDSYLQYSMAVAMARALARVQDGQKPVHRRILFAMRQLGLTSDSKPVKSARIVGDVLGKYHPHGDSSVYDALVRVAQDFNLRYPLITGQGNFGSRDGDNAAAMRYTEARLSPISKLLLDELGQGTVDFGPNYDGSFEEPELLPARLPFLLLNGTEGIAVGLAANIPSHNLREVCAATLVVLENPDASLEEVLAVLPGPDFPDGAQLISSPQEIQAAYSTGRGSLRVRARWVREELARGQWQLVVTELPYQVSTKNILEQLDVLSNPQVPLGKKALTQQQLNLKAIAHDFLDSARDESGKEAKVRIVLTPKTSKVDAEALMAFLLANTSLESSFSLNANMLGLDGNPRTKGLLEILQEWCEFRVTTVKRRTAFELEQTKRRMHILEGRMIAFLNIDQIIKIIRDSDVPQKELVERLAFSDVQALDILEMRLRQLNRLEGVKLKTELDQLTAEAGRLTHLLATPPALRALVGEEVKADCLKFGDDRRTLLKHESRVTQTGAVTTVLAEPMTLVLSKNMWVRAYKGMGVSEAGYVFKTGDQLFGHVEGSTVDPFVVLDDQGRAYSFSAAEIPTKGEGVPLSTLIDLQGEARVLSLMGGEGETLHLFATSSGYGFTAPLKSLWARPRAGKTFVSKEEGSELLKPIALPATLQGYVTAVSTEAKMLAIDVKEVPSRPSGGKGVVLMAVEPGQLHAINYCAESSWAYEGRADGGKPLHVALGGEEWLKYVGKRGRKGAFLPKKVLPS